MPIARLALTALLVVASSSGHPARAADDIPLPTSRAQAITDAVDAWQAAQLRSPDLRIRILASTTSVLDDPDRPDRGVHTQVLIPAAGLFEQARGSTDPLLLDLLLHRCPADARTPAPCDRLPLAERWVEADAQNQMAWLALSMVQQERGDAEASRVSFERASRASRWHDHYTDLARTIADTIPRAFPPQERNLALVRAIGMSYRVLPYGVASTLGNFCREGGAMRDACLRIADTMVRDTDNLMGLSIAPRYAAWAGAAPSVVETYQRKADATRWAMMQDSSRGSLADDLALDDDASRVVGARLDAMITFGEPRLAQRILLDRHLREEDAASRLVASLSPETLAYRAQALRGR